MSSSSKQLCRLCLESSDGLVNIFETFEDSTVASVLAEHFWFQVNQDDGMPEWVCEICWSRTKTFHHFYKRLELRHKNCLNSIVLVKVDEIKQERSVSPVGEAMEADLFVSKCEEELDITIKTDDMQTTSMENSCDEDDNDKRGAQSEAEAEAEQTTDDDDESSPAKPKRYNSLSRSETVKHSDVEIFSFFTKKCDVCGDVEFDTLKTMREHYRQVHQVSKGYLICCGNKYSSRTMMMDHIQYHVNPNSHSCDQCSRQFRNSVTLKTHMKCHVRAYECSLCSKSYSYASILRNHIRDYHSKDASREFPCNQCSKICRTKPLLTSHIRHVHDRSMNHVCEICGRKYKSKLSLQNHKELVHSTTPPPKVQCDKCGTWLKYKRRLRAHLKMHQEIQEAQDGNSQAVSCPICKKKVQNKRLLSKHIKYTHGERNHKCTLCDKAFKTGLSLKEHIAALHTGVDLYSCTYCDRTFKSKANKYSHQKKAHLAEWTRDKAEKDRCNQVAPSETETTAM